MSIDKEIRERGTLAIVRYMEPKEIWDWLNCCSHQVNYMDKLIRQASREV